jgi:hypothetical protein
MRRWWGISFPVGPRSTPPIAHEPHYTRPRTARHRTARQAVASTVDFEVWGDGEQTRSFMYVDDCVEGILRIMMSGFEKPLNLGTEEMVSMNEFAEIAMSFENKALPIRHIPGPQGVRGRNSDNTLIRENIGWEPSIPVREGLREVRACLLACRGLPGCLSRCLSVSMSDRLSVSMSLCPSSSPPYHHFSSPPPDDTTDVLLDQGADREGARRGYQQRLRLLQGACRTVFCREAPPALRFPALRFPALLFATDTVPRVFVASLWPITIFSSHQQVVVQTTESLDVLGKNPNTIPESDTDAGIRLVA